MGITKVTGGGRESSLCTKPFKIVQTMVIVVSFVCSIWQVVVKLSWDCLFSQRLCTYNRICHCGLRLIYHWDKIGCVIVGGLRSSILSVLVHIITRWCPFILGFVCVWFGPLAILIFS